MILWVLKQTQATVWDNPGSIQECIRTIVADPTVPTAVETRQAKADAKEQYLAIVSLMGLDSTCYGPLLIEMENSFLQ